MRQVALVLGMAWAGFVHAHEAIPQVLIVQEKSERAVSISNYLADELDADGRVSPIVWGLTDPYFRAAVGDGILKDTPEFPTQKQAVETANKLKAEYLVILSLEHEGTSLKARLLLFSRGRQIWKDPYKDSIDEAQRKKIEQLNAQMKRRGLPVPDLPPQTDPDYRRFSVTFGGALDEENAARSVARTWAYLLAEGPLKNLVPRPKSETPEVDGGAQIVIPDAPPPTQVNNSQLVLDVQVMLARGDGVGAVNLLRDAIDTEPLDTTRRKMLASTLLNLGMFRVAAEEARRAAAVMPDQIDLWVMAARGWLRVGDLEEANKDLNEAVAREPGRGTVRELLGEIYLAKLDLPAAIDNLNAAIMISPNADTLYLRGVALTIGGETDSARKDFDKAAELGLAADPISVEGRFGTVTSLVDASIVKSGADLRDLLQKARLDRSDPKVGVSAGKLLQYATGLRTLMESITPPEKNKISAERRRLALNLLCQSLTEVQDYLKSGDDETLGEATIDLGESLKQLGQARDLQKSELGQT